MLITKPVIMKRNGMTMIALDSSGLGLDLGRLCESLRKMVETNKVGFLSVRKDGEISSSMIFTYLSIYLSI